MEGLCGHASPCPWMGIGFLHWEVFDGFFWGSLDLTPREQIVLCISPLLLVSGNPVPSWRMQNGAGLHVPWPIPHTIFDMN